MIYGYARCSTNDSKQDIERQIRDLKALGAAEVYSEYASGINSVRPQLQALKDILKSGDTLITTELSRLTRSVHQLCHLIEWAAHRRIVLRAGSLTADCTKDIDPMTEGMLYMMGIFAQIEHKTITQRVKSGVDHARSKGVKLGRPPMTKDRLPQAFHDHYPRFEAGAISKTEFARLVGCPRSSLYRHLEVFRKG